MIRTSIRYFASVARNGSIRGASTELNVAQSAISRQIQALEAELDCLLIERGRRGVVLTDAGRLLVDYALSASEDGQLLKSEIADIESLQRGHLNIAAIESVASQTIPFTVKKFFDLYPNIDIAIDVTTSPEIARLVLSGKAEIGIVFGGAYDAPLKVEVETSEPLLAVMKPSHALAKRASLAIADLADWPVALPPPNSGTRNVFDEACARAEVHIDPVLETNSLELLHRFALQGDGIAILLGQIVASSIAGEALTAVRFFDDGMQGSLQVVTARNEELPIAARAFLVLLRETLQTMPQPWVRPAAR